MRYHPVTWHKKTFNSRVACILYARSRDLGTSGMLMLCVSLVCLVGLGATLPEALGPRGALGQVAGHAALAAAELKGKQLAAQLTAAKAAARGSRREVPEEQLQRRAANVAGIEQKVAANDAAHMR